MLKLEVIEKFVPKGTYKDDELYVNAKVEAYFKQMKYGVLFKRTIDGECKTMPIRTIRDLDKVLEILYGKRKETRLQEKILSLLAMEKEKGNKVLSFDDIKEILEVDSSSAISQAKRMLRLKELVASEGIGKMSLVALNRVYQPKVCKLLTTRRGRTRFCPIKRHFIDDVHYKSMCSCVQDIGYVYTPKCSGWYV